MTLGIRNPEADALAKRLARLDDTTITAAVISALREAIAARARRETPTETARRLLARHRLSFAPDRKPRLPEACHELDPT